VDEDSGRGLEKRKDGGGQWTTVSFNFEIPIKYKHHTIANAKNRCFLRLESVTLTTQANSSLRGEAPTPEAIFAVSIWTGAISGNSSKLRAINGVFPSFYRNNISIFCK
jgi:hypothetical protein